jgi:hypothetical protein
MLFVSLGCLDCELKQGVLRRFPHLHYCITWQHFLHQEKTLPKRFPQVLNFKPGFMGRYGYGWVIVRRKLGGNLFFLFLSFVIDTSQLHYSPVVFDADEALASFSSIN